MIEINNELADYLLKFDEKMPNYIGYFCEQGAVIGDAKLVVVSLDKKIYLAHIDEFEQKGMLIRIKKCKKNQKKIRVLN
jgi:hypothetical protein